MNIRYDSFDMMSSRFGVIYLIIYSVCLRIIRDGINDGINSITYLPDAFYQNFTKEYFFSKII